MEPIALNCSPTPRHDWSETEIADLFDLPLTELVFRAAAVHRRHFDPTEIQVSTLLSIKTGGCAEDCSYCPQSARYDTGLKAEKLMDVDSVLTQARAARDAGAGRFCMGAAWRAPKERDMPKLAAMIESVKALGLETCMTLGMLTPNQAETLADAGLDYYNHNLDSSEAFYPQIITTRTYGDRLDTLANVRRAGMKVCCGGIVGMGESRSDRVQFLRTLATMETHPESVPVNRLVAVEGTPLAAQVELDEFEFVRTIAVARIVMPSSYVRLSAGRETMAESLQALCFLAGANSIFYGEKLLTTANPEADRDRELFARLGLRSETPAVPHADAHVA